MREIISTRLAIKYMQFHLQRRDSDSMMHLWMLLTPLQRHEIAMVFATTFFLLLIRGEIPAALNKLLEAK